METIVTALCVFCGNTFLVGRFNQIYCTSECCKKATNKKILERYHQDRARRKTIRYCACGNKLSKYNPESACYACQSAVKEIDKIKLLEQLGFAYEED